MKKVLIFGLAAVFAAAASIAAFAGNASENHQDGVCVEVASQGYGACTHATCKCTKFNQRPGYYQCWCGHQREVHK